MRTNLAILLTIALCALAVEVFPAEPNLGIQKISPDGYRRELWEGSKGVIASAGKFFTSYVANCEPSQNGQPLNIIAMSVDRATNKWQQGVIGKTICGGAHNYLGGQILQFPAKHPLAGRFIAFYRPHTSTDAQACTGSTPYCIRYSISTQPNDITAWGPPQLVKTASGTVLDQGWPAGNHGDFTSDGVFHAFGNGNGGIVRYTRMKPDLTFEAFAIVRGEIQSNVNSPGCGTNARVYPDGTMDLIWAPGNCSGAAGPLYYARSTDGGNKWVSANKAASFTAASGLTKSGTGTPFGTYPIAYRVRSGTYAANVALNKLSDGTPILAETPPLSNYKPTIHKWLGSGWASYVNAAAASGAHSEINLDVVDDDLIVVTASVRNTIFESVVRGAGTKWESERVLFKQPSGSAQITRVKTSLVTEAGVSRIVSQFAVGWGTLQSIDSTGRHEVYLADRPMECIVGKIDCPVVLPDPVVEPPPPVDPVKPPLRFNLVGDCLIPADQSDGVCTVTIKGVTP